MAAPMQWALPAPSTWPSTWPVPTSIHASPHSAAACLPSNIVTKDDLAKKVDTSDQWIRERTGIRQRHIALPGEKTSDLALAASRAALIDAGIDAGELAMII